MKISPIVPETLKRQEAQEFFRKKTGTPQHNTGNTGYGFDQVDDSSEDDQPGQAGHSDSDDPEPNVYRFAAPGNRGSLAERLQVS